MGSMLEKNLPDDEKTGNCCDADRLYLSPDDCPIMLALSVIGGKWKIPILYSLREGPVRFNELQRIIKGITQKMLTQCLRDLESQGLVHREVYPQVPPKVEYSLTPLAKKLDPILCSLCTWGDEYKENALKRVT